MKITSDSHLDHGLLPEHLAFLQIIFADRTGFFIETVTLPWCDTIACGLHGPAMGDAPIAESDVGYVKRGDRQYHSRVTNLPTRPTRQLTVIAGPHNGDPCVLYTAFGGPPTPREPDDPSLPESERAASIEFWRQHALTTDEPLTPNPGYADVSPEWVRP